MSALKLYYWYKHKLLCGKKTWVFLSFKQKYLIERVKYSIVWLSKNKYKIKINFSNDRHLYFDNIQK
jgi:hypothetical protein